MKLNYASMYKIKDDGLDVLYDQALPIKVSVIIRKFLKSLQDELTIFDPIRKNILDKYCTVDQERGVYVFPSTDSEVFDDFAKEYNESMSADAEVNWRLIDVEALSEVKNLVVTPKVIDVIESLNDLYNTELNSNVVPFPQVAAEAPSVSEG